MAPIATIAKPAAAANTKWQRDRRFFTAWALAAGITVFVGFARTYYLKGIYRTQPLPLLVHIHGLLFSAWIVLLITQTSLVAIRRTDLHRRLGMFGIALAGVMTLVGYFTAMGALERGRMPTAFLAVPLTTVVLFPSLIAAAFFMRQNKEAHRRLMLIATTELLLAPVGRWPFVQDWGALGSYAVTDIFIAALVVYDLITRRRLHPVTIWAGLLFIASQPLRQILGGTAAWLTFVHWLTS